jgi:hypothetical protein
MKLELHGHPVHTRSLGAVLRRQSDAHLEARGEILDLRRLGVLPMTSDLQTAGPIHNMRIRLVIARDSRRLLAIELEQPTVAFEASAATAGESCRDPAPRLQALVGETLDAAFPKRLGTVLGGPRACSHVLTLFQLMASALPPALDFEEQRAREEGPRGWARGDGELVFKRAFAIDGLRAGEDSLDLAGQLSDFHTRPFSREPGPMERLERQRELRLAARVGVDKIRIEALRAAERERSGADLAAGQWRSLDGDVAPLVGRSVASGLARELLARFGDRPDRQLLLDALLHLGPAVVQCTPALVDFVIGAGAAAPSGRASGEGAAKPAPAGAPAGARTLSGAILMGGFPDSCFMWRKDGVLARGRERVEAIAGREARGPD